MAKEILAIPEEQLLEVVRVIRAGLQVVDVSRETFNELTKWCNKEVEYLGSE